MPVGIAELDGDLAAGAATPLEIDWDVVPSQVIACAQDLVECRNLEGQVIELEALRCADQRPDKRHAMMVGIAAHEHHAAGNHLLGIDIRDREAEHLCVELNSALEVGDIEHDMTELGDAKRQAKRPLQALDIRHPLLPPCRL